MEATPQLDRYDTATLERMLVSYRALAENHSSAGHYAFARWARSMCGHITRELNFRAYREAETPDVQLVLVEPGAYDES